MDKKEINWVKDELDQVASQHAGRETEGCGRADREGKDRVDLSAEPREPGREGGRRRRETTGAAADAGLQRELRQLRRETGRVKSERNDSVRMNQRLRELDAREVILTEGRAQPWTKDRETREYLAASADRMVEERFGRMLQEDVKWHKLQDRIHFQDANAFKKRYIHELKRLQPELSDKEVEASAEKVQAYCQDSEIYVNEGAVIPFRVLVHEKIHQVSADNLRGEMGAGFDEGLTEYLARRAAGEVPSVDLVHDSSTGRLIRLQERYPKGYQREWEIVSRTAAAVGEEALARAKFQGEMSSLEKELDRALGEGFYRNLSSKLAQMDRINQALDGMETPDPGKLRQLDQLHEEIKQDFERAARR